MKGLQTTQSTTTGKHLHARDKDHVLLTIPSHCIWANYKSARLRVSNTLSRLTKTFLGLHDLKQRSYSKPYANLPVPEHFAPLLLLLPHSRVTRRICLGQVLLN